MTMIDRLSADELAELVCCKPNQRSVMVRWLLDRNWKFEVDRLGLPIVARAYYERKMGLADERNVNKYADEPNRKVFA